MRSIIEDFFNGEQIPGEQGPRRNIKEYREECRKAAKAEETLCAGLEPGQEALFEEYKQHQNQAAYMEISDKFIYGFCLGMAMAAEVYEVREE